MLNGLLRRAGPVKKTTFRDEWVPITSFNSATTAPYIIAATDAPNVEVTSIDAAEFVTFSWYCPHDFQALIEAVVITIPNATGDEQFDLAFSSGAIGEQADNGADSSANTIVAGTSGILGEFDVSGVMGSIAKDRYCTLKITSDDANMELYGMRMKYRIR